MSKENDTQAFLDAYRELECAVRNEKSMLVASYEDLLEEPDKSRLMICRQMRNYLVHTGKDFIVPSRGQTSFLKEMRREVLKSAGTVKDRYKTLKMLKAVMAGEDLFGEVLEKVGKITLNEQGFLPFVSDGKVTGFLTEGELLEMYSSKLYGRRTILKHRLTEWVSPVPEGYGLKETPVRVSPDTPLAELENDTMYIVTNARGKDIGLYWKGMK